MFHVYIVVRESRGRLKPDYSLEFALPEIPRVGDYLSIQRPDHRKPYGEDLVVRQVWWRLAHSETGPIATDPPKVGKVDEIYVECDPVIGPWSSDDWRNANSGAEEMKVARLDIRESEFKSRT
ncbi:MAG TPA: hypothetical protein VHC39_14095 [Rhizomicrobium sp.]|nr:hypothetical protein [Rhizomicrobium sp.]